MKVLVTGGTGYIGSHTAAELLMSGYEVVIVDNLSNSEASVAERIARITGKNPAFYIGDVLDEALLDRIFSEHKIDAVIHFAALKSVPASMSNPLLYYHNNVSGTLSLCRAMHRYEVKNIVFSSSATVYGISDDKPIGEDAPLSPKNVYGNTKLMMETVLTDLYRSDPEWNVTLLRYFNPIGAHESGLIGEVPAGSRESHALYHAGCGRAQAPSEHHRNRLRYPRRNGRARLHTRRGLARGHIKALENSRGLGIYNLGTGAGTASVRL